ncbi:MAG TPA: alpha/beta hydrolase [Stellaceae bacterium]|nr:alpha/beta hydrolase [Stellaceae bacterium]
MRTLGMAAVAFAAALVLGALPAAAQLQNLPPWVEATIVGLGPNLNSDMIQKSFAAMRPLQAPRDELAVERNASYGGDPLQKLDLWRPVGKPAAGGAPIVLFVHGGGFVRGDKGDYDNIPAYFARHGMVGANMNYRLAPKAKYPDATLDVGSAVQWLAANAARYGGDPKRIVVVGHSAGAAIVASYALDLSIETTRTGVVGAVIISVPAGHTGERRTADNVYYGTNAAKDEPLAHVGDGSKMPLLIAMTEFDPAALAADSHEVAAALCLRDKICPPFLWLSGHNHISEVATLDTKDDRLGSTIAEFVARVAP